MGEESKIETKMKEYAEELGLMFLKFVSPGNRGVPDRIIIGHQSVMAFAELKKPKETPNEKQLKMHEKFCQRGFEVQVIDNLDDGLALLEDIARISTELRELELGGTLQ